MSTDAVDQHEQNFSSPVVIISLALILLAFFLMGFFSLYFCKCLADNIIYAWVFRHSPNNTPVSSGGPSPNRLGLDPKIIDKFPTFVYSSVKSYRREKYGLECAICLVEFNDDDMLRLLPTCSHVFHQECVDLWLEKHTTCPACRTNLDLVNLLSPGRLKQSCQLSQSPSFENAAVQNRDNERESPEGSFISITIKDENEDEKVRSEAHSTGNDINGGENGGGQNAVSIEEKFSKCHTTGHSSIYRINNNNNDINRGEDRFTLRLPENVKEEILKGHNPSKSCTVF